MSLFDLIRMGPDPTRIVRVKPDRSIRHLTDEQLLAESIAALTYLTVCREEIARRNLGRNKKDT